MLRGTRAICRRYGRGLHSEPKSVRPPIQRDLRQSDINNKLSVMMKDRSMTVSTHTTRMGREVAIVRLSSVVAAAVHEHRGSLNGVQYMVFANWWTCRCPPVCPAGRLRVWRGGTFTDGHNILFAQLGLAIPEGQALGGVMSSPLGVGRYHIWHAKCFIWINQACCSQGTPGTWIALRKLVNVVTCPASPIGHTRLAVECPRHNAAESLTSRYRGHNSHHTARVIPA